MKTLLCSIFGLFCSAQSKPVEVLEVWTYEGKWAVVEVYDEAPMDSYEDIESEELEKELENEDQETI